MICDQHLFRFIYNALAFSYILSQLSDTQGFYAKHTTQLKWADDPYLLQDPV